MVLLFVGCSDSARRSVSAVEGTTTTVPAESTPTSAALDGSPGTELAVASEASANPGTTVPPTTITVRGTVISSVDGAPLAEATVSANGVSVVTDADGSFVLTGVTAENLITVERPVWQARSVELSASDETLVVELEPVVVRALRVSRYVAADPAAFENILQLADQSVVNALVFDTKDETDTVLYDTGVAFANETGAVDAVYEPALLLAKAKEHDLYTITRIVTFEDSTWVRSDPEAKLAGAWVDASNRENWTYPIELAVEACMLGFDEIQFDYVRFPAGRTAVSAAQLIPSTAEDRAAVIADFLGEARSQLHPLGCGVSAAVFGIVMSSDTDEGIGQTPETVSAAVDAVSPMLYPSHYSSGWLGFADPNDHPGPVVAHALDSGADRMAPSSLMRPWLQGFYYGGTDVLEQIRETEARGAGWIIWNASGRYELDWLPSS